MKWEDIQRNGGIIEIPQSIRSIKTSAIPVKKLFFHLLTPKLYQLTGAPKPQIELVTSKEAEPFVEETERLEEVALEAESDWEPEIAEVKEELKTEGEEMTSIESKLRRDEGVEGVYEEAKLEELKEEEELKREEERKRELQYKFSLIEIPVKEENLEYD